MASRFITLLLMLGIMLPSSVFGALAHRCEMSRSARVAKPACCQGREHELPAVDGMARLTHHCQTESSPVSQVAAVNPRLQIDAGLQLEAALSSGSSLRLPPQAFRSFSILPTPRARGGGVPVFLRTCTFLI